MKRQSSASSQNSRHVLSPGSAGEHQPLRHVKAGRHTKIVLPRGHGSGRNLPKVARQAQNNQNNHVAEDGRKQSRQKSHDGDTDIRLPGSLDESRPAPMRRNMTAYQLPRNTSNAKLKKNLSHGQLTWIGSGRNLQGLNSTASKGPPSPGLKNKHNRPKSADMTNEIHEQEAEVARERQEKKEGTKKVGFAVGSDTSEGEDTPQMEGSGLQEDEWTDQSASASPYSTRQNTANNSRRASIIHDKPPDKRDLLDASNARPDQRSHHMQSAADQSAPEADGTPAQSYKSDDEEEPPSPRTLPHEEKGNGAQTGEASQQSLEAPSSRRSSLHAAKEHINPAARPLLARKNQSNPAPALVSNVSALDDTRSARGSPAASIRSSRSNIGDGAADQDQDELVSRFIPSTSHPSTGSGGNTAMNTPKASSILTRDNENTLAAQHGRIPVSSFHAGPVSPGSTISGSSGAATPAVGRSRTELRLMNEKAMAEMEDAAVRNPIIPAHVYDRRNESLKSYLNLAALGGDGRGGLSATTGLSLGPEIFQGRFKAVNTELKVVQRFRDPIGESVTRLVQCRDSKVAQLRAQKISSQKQAPAKVPISKSAISLPKQGSKLSTSTSPPRSASPVKPALTNARSSTQVRGSDGSSSRRGKVTFSQTPPETREIRRSEDEAGADAIARQMWESIGA